MLLLFAVLLTGGVTASSSHPATTPPASPIGVTGIPLDGTIQLAWQPVTGATSYNVYRSTVPTSTGQLVNTTAITGTTFTDSTAVVGTTYYYVVHAVSSGGESGDSLVVQATPVNRSCSSGNAVVLENCFPGTTNWKLTDSANGLAGYATASSINRGQSVDLKVTADAATTMNVEIYRSGYYGGTGARLFSVIQNVPVAPQSGCTDDPVTGLFECSRWQPNLTITTTSSWPTGVYLVRMIKANGGQNHVIFVVRDDASTSQLLYGVPFTTYQAYNPYGGRSLYDFNSSGANTVAGTPRAVKVSFDRPYSGANASFILNWYTRTDYPQVYWLEQMGYDVSYISNTDLETQPGLLLAHHAYWSGAHDEYTSAAMRAAEENGRDHGVRLFFSGGNENYWKIRFEANPTSGQSGRVEVCYKSTQSGVPDPSGIPTGTWRDPAGANQPENAVSGEMYIGDNDSTNFPLLVTAGQGKDRVYRYTSLASQAPGTSTLVGTGIVGWEWDARVANGFEPAGVVTLASSPVNGGLIQNNGQFQIQGSATQNAVKYMAPSGALVFATGANNWGLGLARNADGNGEPNQIIQQVTTNILEDMWVIPQTPIAGIQLDSATPAPPAPTSLSGQALVRGGVSLSWTAVPGSDGYNVYRTTSPRSGGVVGMKINSSLVTGTTFTDSTAASSTGYYYVVTAVGGGAESQASNEASVTTVTPLSVSSTNPADGASGVTRSVAPRATFSRAVDPSTLTTSSFTLSTSTGTLVPATVAWDATHQLATLSPTSPLSSLATYTARITTDVTASDGVPLGAPVQWRFTTGSSTATAPTVTSVSPTAGSVNVDARSTITATFSSAMDATAINGSSFTVTGPSGPVAGSIAYNATTRTATFTPASRLGGSSTYTVRLDTTILASDETPLASAVTWTFSTLPAPTIVQVMPAPGVTFFARTGAVRVVFSRSMDPTTITSSSFVLKATDGTVVPATVTYDDTTFTATLQPSQMLAGYASFSVSLLSSISGADGTALAAPLNWSFSTATCPCSLMGTLQPSLNGLAVQDGRTGSGPWTYEMGVKVVADEPVNLTAIRFYKQVGELGTHIGKVWSSTGTLLGSVTFANESASGWQQQALTTPVPLAGGTTYIVSVNLNTFFGTTYFGLANQIVSGPFRSVADGLNGVFGQSAGAFPSRSYKSSNYYVDAVVDPSSPTPATETFSPGSGATGIAVTAPAKVVFSRSVDPATVTTSSVTVSGPSGVVSATVSYDDSTRTVTVAPSSPLAYGTSYTISVSNAVRSRDGMAVSAGSSGFTTVPPPPPQVAYFVPGNNTSDVGSGVAPRAAFNKPMDPSSLNATSLTVSGPSGAVAGTVSYDSSQNAIVFTPTSPLVAGTTYTGRVDGSVRAADGSTLGTAQTWTFTIGGSMPPLAVTGGSPAAGATGVLRDSAVKVTFNRSIDPASLTGTTIHLRAADGSMVPASIGYDQSSLTATLTPSSQLSVSATYTVEVTAGVTDPDGQPLSAASSWTFTTGACPCQLFSPVLAPSTTGNSVQDGRTGAGPWSYELGVKIAVDTPVSLRSIRFYKDAKETGTHIGTVWSTSGVKLATVTFTNETASGWQQQALATPLPLQAGTTYIVSVGFNAFFDVTTSGLKVQYTSGPLHSVADGQNGVFGSAAGVFPSTSWNSSNYFIDAVVG